MQDKQAARYLAKGHKSIKLKKSITLINPPLIIQRNDYLGSGIPYMPIMLAYLAGGLKTEYELNVIDAFGENPFQLTPDNNFLVQGLSVDEIIHKISPVTDYIIIYISSIMVNFMVHKIIKRLKTLYPHTPILLMENTQGVIGCALEYIYQEFMDTGADFIVLGEGEQRIPCLLDILIQGNLTRLTEMDGVIYKNTKGIIIHQPKKYYIQNLDTLDFPSWEYFPLTNYWKLGYAHGPMQGNYLALMTSRGCPYNCNFCVVPATNGRKWRARTPENVVNEIIYMMDKFGVNEFHWEDLNPTAGEGRILEICRLIIEKGLTLRWKLASGSKIETMNIKTLDLMRQAGCNYISFSPETGSKKVLNLMNKAFNYEYALRMTKRMSKLKITTQACFVLGYPGEIESDLKETRCYLKKLIKAGIDEVAFFIMTPIPGTKTFGQLSGYKDYSELTFSPAWRKDYKYLCGYRNKLYRCLFFGKLLHHPVKLFMQGINFITKNFKSKAEMNIYRMFKINRLMNSSRSKLRGS